MIWHYGEGDRKTKCGANERRWRRLDGDNPFFSPKTKMQTIPFESTTSRLAHLAGLLSYARDNL